MKTAYFVLFQLHPNKFHNEKSLRRAELASTGLRRWLPSCVLQELEGGIFAWLSEEKKVLLVFGLLELLR